MNAHSRLAHRPRTARRGFTLVEILTVVLIIGILMAFAVPAVFRALERAKVGRVRVEIEGMEQAINSYNTKYGDFPPDFIDFAIVQRHYRKAFPNIATSELSLLQRALDVNLPNDSDASIAVGAHDPTKMDRAEALYWALGGFSSDPQFPFTGPGGPLELIPGEDPTLPASYQVNVGRDNALFEFDLSGLTISKPDASAVLSSANKAMSTDETGPGTVPDLFPIYLNSEGGPYVYFDSRTYTAFDPSLGFNGYGHPTYGLIRPYASDQPVVKTTTSTYEVDSGSSDPMVQAAFSLTAWEFVNPNTFQILSAGLDGTFGLIADFDADGNGTIEIDEPAYMQYPSGNAIVAFADATDPGMLQISTFRRFQNQGDANLDEEGQIDNITNFSIGKVVDDVPE